MTPDPEGLLAVAALQRCMAARDYAGAARLVTQRATLAGLNSLAGLAGGLWQSEAERAYRESVAAWRAEHEASLRRQQERDLAAVVAVLAAGFEEAAGGYAARQPAGPPVFRGHAPESLRPGVWSCRCGVPLGVSQTAARAAMRLHRAGLQAVTRQGRAAAYRAALGVAA